MLILIYVGREPKKSEPHILVEKANKTIGCNVPSLVYRPENSPILLIVLKFLNLK